MLFQDGLGCFCERICLDGSQWADVSPSGIAGDHVQSSGNTFAMTTAPAMSASARHRTQHAACCDTSRAGLREPPAASNVAGCLLVLAALRDWTKPYVSGLGDFHTGC